jgi:hypothetical protein
MPPQNRVTPNGDLIRHPSRAATLMGNRGILHDEHQEIVRYSRGKLWIACRLDFKGRQRAVMSPGRYSELFFLDEAVALAAGHRPCGECRRADYKRFTALWQQENADLLSGPFSAGALDSVLQAERKVRFRAEKRTFEARLDDLPNGVYVWLGERDAYWLVWEGRLLRWSAGGYVRAMPRPTGQVVTVLTPPSIVRTLAAGYVPAVHPSAEIG